MATRRFTEPLDLGVEMSGLPETGADVADELTLSKLRGVRDTIASHTRFNIRQR